MSRGAKSSCLIPVLCCGALRAAVAAWLCGLSSSSYLLVGLGAAPFVPRLVGSYDTFMMILSLCPDILFVYLLSSHLPERLNSEATIGVPRVGSRRRWALMESAQVAARVFAYEIFSAFLLNTLATLAGMQMQPQAQGIATGECVALSGLLCVVWTLSINLVALGRDALVGFAAITGLHLATLLGLNVMPAQAAKSAAMWLISARGTPAWHSQVCELYGISTDAAADMSPIVSILILTLLTLALCAALIQVVNRRDLM